MTRPDASPATKGGPVAGVAGLLRAAGGGDASARRLLEGRGKLVLAVEGLEARSRARARAYGLALAAGAAALVAAWLALGRPGAAPALTYAIAGGGAGDRGYVSVAEGAARATLRFSDGSEVALAPGARGRVASTTADGGDVVLEGGLASVNVVHRARSRWTFDAGPYVVRVTGTAFSVAWSAERGALDVWMREGRVVVAGPAAPQGVALVAGQHLRAEAPAGSLLIDHAPPPATPPAAATPIAAPPAGEAPPVRTGETVPPSAPGEAPPVRTGETVSPSAPGEAPPVRTGETVPPSAPGEAPPVRTGEAVPPSAPGEAATRLPAGEATPRPADAPPASWSKLVAAGDYDAVLGAARQQGEGAALSTRPAGDVRALADAARYRGDAGLAGRAYATLRARFASSPEARTAAFLLGRLAEEQQHAPAAALRWYDTYLNESPRGPLAGDALGRKMVLTSRGSVAAARGLALEYLRRFPNGAYAGAARDLSR